MIADNSNLRKEILSATQSVIAQLPAKIAMLICYYGEFPWYFRFFLKSCASNPDIDFFIISDSVYQGYKPDNVYLVNKSMEDIKRAAFEKLAFEISLEEAYKLCDLKPAYGFLFSELIEGYNFWGHGDIDVIYGNIRSFVNDKMLSIYDVISVRKEYISGFFVLYRNTSFLNSLFQLSRDYVRVFQEPVSHCFDECNFSHLELVLGKSIFEIQSDVQCMTNVVKTQSRLKNVKSLFRTMVLENVPGDLEWQRDKFQYLGSQPILLYHLIDFKRLYFKIIPDWKYIPDHYFINKFYISKYHPRSFTGRLESLVYKTWKYCDFKVQTFMQFISWSLKYLKSSSIVKPSMNALLPEVLGVFSMKEFRFFVFIEKKRIKARLGDQPPVNLRYRHGKKFVVAKFNVMSDINIDVEFQQNRLHKQTVHILAFGSPPIILTKD